LKTTSPIYPPRKGARITIFENQYLWTYSLSADFGAYTKEYFVTDYGQRVGVVAVRRGSVLLIRQYRLLIDGLSWEIPGGGVNGDETTEAAAVRECQEEAGITCRRLEPLITYHPGLDTLRNPTTIFFTEDFEEAPKAIAEGVEVVGCEWTPFRRCIEMVFERQITDSMSIVALLACRVSERGQIA
jgi:8-oxo-dGTP pyrophosphatase MutT (NUDIX family)